MLYIQSLIKRNSVSSKEIMFKQITDPSLNKTNRDAVSRFASVYQDILKKDVFGIRPTANKDILNSVCYLFTIA